MPSRPALTLHRTACSGRLPGGEYGNVSLDGIRSEYLDATVAVEALWAVVRSRAGRNSVDSLREALARAFNSVAGSPNEPPDLEALRADVTRQLRVASLSILPTETGADDYEYQLSLEALARDMHASIHR